MKRSNNLFTSDIGIWRATDIRWTLNEVSKCEALVNVNSSKCFSNSGTTMCFSGLFVISLHKSMFDDITWCCRMSEGAIPQLLAKSSLKWALAPDNSFSVASGFIFFSSVLEMGNSSGKMRFLIASENLYFFYESLISKVLAVNSAITIKVWILWSKLRAEAIFRSIHQTCSIKRVVPKNFIIFTGKHLCWSLFFK